jgi:hypothetical protein
MNMLKEAIGIGSRAIPTPEPEQQQKPATLLVIQADAYDWKEIFGGCRLRDGRAINVVQLGWDRLLVTADSPGMSARTPLLVHIRPAADGTGGGTIAPDFVLVRNEVRGATHTEDYRNALFGLMFAGVPAVNSLSSIYNFLERPLIQAELNKLQRHHGTEAFPVVEQSFFDGHNTMMYGGSFPAVLKVGHAHAGFGKMVVPNHRDWEDVRSVVAMTDGKYCTAEPFMEGEYDLRIQRIAKPPPEATDDAVAAAEGAVTSQAHYRVFKRVSMYEYGGRTAPYPPIPAVGGSRWSYDGWPGYLHGRCAPRGGERAGSHSGGEWDLVRSGTRGLC